jgi:hypothetical protein
MVLRNLCDFIIIELVPSFIFDGRSYESIIMPIVKSASMNKNRVQMISIPNLFIPLRRILYLGQYFLAQVVLLSLAAAI